MLSKLCVTLLVFLAVYEARGALLQLPKTTTCLQDSECGTNECCAKLWPFIMSRDIHTIPELSTVQGTCKPYLQQREVCGGILSQNAHCRCAPNLYCHRYPPTYPLTNLIGKRKIAAGTYLCEPKLVV